MISQPYDCLPGRPGATAHRPMGPAARAERGSFLNHYEGKCGFREIHISDKKTGGIFLFIEKGPGLYSNAGNIISIICRTQLVVQI